ncbi:MAG: hypothetical protein M3Y87_14425, partial [Myxococcota bacterium]|nr:hypothetical protein [Myxococcota bacterium]
SFLTVGVVGLAVSWYFWTEIDARGQEINRATTSAELTERQRAFNDALLPVALTGFAGAALATVALPMLLPEQDGVPWWSWIAGAAGLGVAGVGAYFLATDGACYGTALLDARCAKQSPHGLLGGLVLAHAAPLLTVPITYLVRSALGDGVRAGAATLRIQPMGAGLSLSGSF